MLGKANKKNTKKQPDSHSIDEHIGTRMQLRRAMMGLSQKDLAHMCNVTFQQIQKYETATNRIAASRLFELSAALQTPISFFFAGLPGYMEREPRNGRLPKSGVADSAANDPLARNESLELINMSWKLPTDGQREIIFKLLRTMTDKK